MAVRLRCRAAHAMNDVAVSSAPVPTVPARPGALRFGNIDIVRGVAALMVAFQHAAERAGIFGSDQRFLTEWFNAGQAAVIAFFLVSGFVIPLSLEKGRSLKRFATSRILRIYPLYLVTFALTAMVIGDVPSVKTIVAQVAFASEYLHTRNYVGNSWTLSIEAVWYVLFAGLFFLNRNRSATTIVALFVALIGAMAVLTLTGHRAPMGRAGMLATCGVGLFAYRAVSERNLRAFLIPAAVLVPAIAAGLVIGFGLSGYHGKIDFSLRAIALSWTFGYALFFGSFLLKLPHALDVTLRKLGEISFSVYLMHTFALWLIAATGLTGWAYIAGVIAISIPMAMLTYSYIELPAIRLSHRWPRRDPRAVRQEPTALGGDTPGPAAPPLP